MVEFWATWCVPCRECIPHLTALQAKYKAAIFISVSILENDPKLVVPFVKKMGPKMGYRVAMDLIPPGKDGKSGLMATRWMQAAGQQGIPKAFLIDQQGRIAWVGHPLLLEGPLQKVLAGTWDIAAEAMRMKRKARIEREYAVVRARTQVLYRGDGKESFEARAVKVLAAMDEALAQDPDLEERLGHEKFLALLHAEQPLVAAEYGDKLIIGSFKENYIQLHRLAYSVVDIDAKLNPDPKDVPALVAMSLRAALRADAVSQQKEWSIADTLACAYFLNGKFDLAVSTQERAIRLGQRRSLEEKQTLEQHLARFRAARK